MNTLLLRNQLSHKNTFSYDVGTANHMIIAQPIMLYQDRYDLLVGSALYSAPYHVCYLISLFSKFSVLFLFILLVVVLTPFIVDIIWKESRRK